MLGNAFEIHGHRGCRGLLPENTLIGFTKAIEIGITALELDIVLSKDDQVVISHEGYFHPNFCLRPDGSDIEPNEKIWLYDLDYNEIRTYDCGSKANPAFTQQLAKPSFKPTLQMLIDMIDGLALEKEISLNIEVKIEYDDQHKSRVSREIFAEKILEVLQLNNYEPKCLIQSFDQEILRIINKKQPDIQIGLLNDQLKTAKKCISDLGFLPSYYNPYYKLVTPKMINNLHQRDIKIVPWTVNKKQEMKRLIQMGVDGIITDYPDVLVGLVAENRT